MASHTSEREDTAVVRRLIFEPCGLGLDPIPCAPGNSKTPDFRILESGAFRGYCEVKSPRDDRLDELATLDTVFGGDRPDPTFNRIARHVKKAAEQFAAVNPDREHPNVLVFVNHDGESGASDLVEALTGLARTDSGALLPTCVRLAANLADIKGEIDLYVWIDGGKQRVTGWVLGNGNARHARIVKGLFRNLLPT